MKRLLGATLLVFFGCSHAPESRPPQLSAADVNPPGALPGPGPTEAREIELTLDRRLEKCPHVDLRFPFDEAQTVPQDRPELRELAACLNSAPYQDVKLRLIGRTDSQGGKEYNQELGLQRAEYVKKQLVANGVDENRIATVSAGEKAAADHGEYNPPVYNRRVDVVQLAVITPM